VLKKFNEDDETRLVLLLGEPGGDLEIKAAEYIKTAMKKPVLAYIMGQDAPKGKKMGHAGALISRKEETAEAKKEILQAAGAFIVPVITQIPQTIGKFKLKNRA
jgi:succinyl-CoA synthetase alpha subunit